MAHTPESRIRWGLLSTANINRRLIPAIRLSPRGELVAVASRDRAKAESYARKWEIPRAFGTYEAMLDSDEVDAVYISLPNHLHAEWTMRALQAGKHVLCEKPMAISLEEVDAMIAASRSSGRYLAEAFMYRHHPQTKLVGEWVRSGRLGEVRQVWSVFNFSMHSEDDVRLLPEYGGGCLWDVGVYPMSLAQFIFGGPPQWVFGAQRLGRSGVDEDFAGICHYPGDRSAEISSSFRSPFYTWAEVIGSEGRLSLSKPFNDMETNRHMIYYPEKGDPREIAVPEVELYLGEVEDLHAAALDGAPQYLTLEESRNHIRTVLALYASARDQKVVHL